MESLEEIESKLSLYQTQLEQVNQLLESDPDNSQFVSLKDDLEKVISLTQTLFQQYYPNEYASKEQQSSDTAKGTSTLNIRKRSRDDSHDNLDENDDYNLSDLEADNVSDLDEEIPKGTAPALLAPKTGPLQVNDRIEVSAGGDRSYAGIITEIINGKEFKVRYFGYTEEASLPLSSLRRIPPGPYVLQYDQIHNDYLTVGMTCQCKYSADQQFYDVTITEKTNNGYLVTYTGYGNSEEVPLEYLRPAPVLTLAKVDVTGQPATLTTGSTVGVSTKEAHHRHNTNPSEEKKSQLIPIPANLKILPTDTEEEKKRKQKKIKAIKNKNRIISQEEEVAQVQQTWKKFVNKGSKKSFSAIGKSSLFASSDAVSSKVGVTNSGRGMTQYGERKKYKFESDH